LCLALAIIPFASTSLPSSLHWPPSVSSSVSVIGAVRPLPQCAVKVPISHRFHGVVIVRGLVALMVADSRGTWRQCIPRRRRGCVLLFRGGALLVNWTHLVVTRAAVLGLDCLIAIGLTRSMAMPALWWETGRCGRVCRVPCSRGRANNSAAAKFAPAPTYSANTRVGGTSALPPGSAVALVSDSPPARESRLHFAKSSLRSKKHSFAGTAAAVEPLESATFRRSRPPHRIAWKSRAGEQLDGTCQIAFENPRGLRDA